MIFQVVVSNKNHPEYGQATIPFPIPASEYDQTIELLEGLTIGSPTVQDCQVDKLDGPYPILNRLAAQSVNVDELDYLAKRLEGFCESEISQFQAMASKLRLSDMHWHSTRCRKRRQTRNPLASVRDAVHRMPVNTSLER